MLLIAKARTPDKKSDCSAHLTVDKPSDQRSSAVLPKCDRFRDWTWVWTTGYTCGGYYPHRSHAYLVEPSSCLKPLTHATHCGILAVRLWRVRDLV